jgi:hypothetical protein
MNEQSDLLQQAVGWLGTRGLLGVFLAAVTTALRWLMGFDHGVRQLALSFVAALFVIVFVAPGISLLLGLDQAGSAMSGAILGLIARPLLEALMRGARVLRDDAGQLIKAWLTLRLK